MLKIILLLFLLHFYTSQDDCCYGETWRSCPQDCKDGKRKANRCCGIDYICAAGGGCIYRYDVERELKELREKITDENCDYYKTLESFFNCGEKGYPMGYGGKYCNKYKNK